MGKKSELIPIEPAKNLPLVDCHCHLPYGSKSNNEKDVLTYQRFLNNNGKFLISCSIDKKTLLEIQKFKDGKQNIYLAAGWAPQTVTYTPESRHISDFTDWLEFIKNNVEDYVGIGEIGLDFHHAKTLEKREKQIEIFTKIISETKHLNRPYIIHLRNAGSNELDPKNPKHEYNQPDAVNKIMVKIFEEQEISFNKVMLHCFSGPKEWGRKLSELGFYISVPSSAYGFKRWRASIEDISLDQLLTETDSPFQHPFQFGGDNEPANVNHSIAAIAYIKQLQQEVVAENVVNNAKKFFKINH